MDTKTIVREIRDIDNGLVTPPERSEREKALIATAHDACAEAGLDPAAAGTALAVIAEAILAAEGRIPFPNGEHAAALVADVVVAELAVVGAWLAA